VEKADEEAVYADEYAQESDVGEAGYVEEYEQEQDYVQEGGLRQSTRRMETKRQSIRSRSRSMTMWKRGAEVRLCGGGRRGGVRGRV